MHTCWTEPYPSYDPYKIRIESGWYTINHNVCNKTTRFFQWLVYVCCVCASRCQQLLLQCNEVTLCAFDIQSNSIFDHLIPSNRRQILRRLHILHTTGAYGKSGTNTDILQFENYTVFFIGNNAARSMYTTWNSIIFLFVVAIETWTG